MPRVCGVCCRGQPRRLSRSQPEGKFASSYAPGGRCRHHRARAPAHSIAQRPTEQLRSPAASNYIRAALSCLVILIAPYRRFKHLINISSKGVVLQKPSPELGEKKKKAEKKKKIEKIVKKNYTEQSLAPHSVCQACTSLSFSF